MEWGNIILLAIFTEAIVELWKKAAPLSPIKDWLVAHTPFLYSEAQQTHLLLCPFCCATYVAFVSGFLYFYMDIVAVRWLVIVMATLRLSNWVHLVFSWIRDKQYDIRVNRGRRE
jgi:hypothetical protein